MPQRLTPLEVSWLARDTTRRPAHLGTVAILEPTRSLCRERLVELVDERIAYVPRYRQRVRAVPGELAPPVWVDDDRFELRDHVSSAALPSPGSATQLAGFVSELMARQLDRNRPLWEMCLVDSLQGGRAALVTRSHLSLVDGVDTAEISHVLLDATDDPAEPVTRDWHPLPEPTALDLVAGAVVESVRNPIRGAANLQGALAGAAAAVLAVADRWGGQPGWTAAAEMAATRRDRTDPLLTGPVSKRRRVALAAAPLADVRAIREAFGYPVHDVVLAAITAGLRSWLLARGGRLAATSSVTAAVPLSVPEEESVPTALGSDVAARLQALPIGEPDPVRRLRRLAYGTRASGRTVAARDLTDIAGFAPSTLHALGVRASVAGFRRPELVVSNAPGPVGSRYLAGSPLLASYPVLPLTGGQVLAVGVTSYAGQLWIGLTADGEAIDDLDCLASGIATGVAELRAVRARQRVGASTRSRSAPTGPRAR